MTWTYNNQFLSLFLALAINIAICSRSWSGRGAIVALAPKDCSNVRAFAPLINRNKSIKEYLWQMFIEKYNSSLPDIVVFHESDIPLEVQSDVIKQSMELPIKFIKLRRFDFAKYNDMNNTEDPSHGGFKQIYEHCPATARSSGTKIGYKHMCRFWSLGFLEYTLHTYDWVLRLDDDCEIFEKIIDPIDDLINPHIFMSSPGWQLLQSLRFDKIDMSTSISNYDGVVVTGLGRFTVDFAERYALKSSSLGLPENILKPLNHSKIISMMAPYTNALFVNLRWLRVGLRLYKQLSSSTSSIHQRSLSSNSISIHEYQAYIILQFLHEVDESNCMYSNRWGDMPIWGAALALVEHTVRFLKLPYYHESHAVVIKQVSLSGFYRKDIPLMIVFSDNRNHSDINTRVTNDSPPLWYPHWPKPK